MRRTTVSGVLRETLQVFRHDLLCAGSDILRYIQLESFAYTSLLLLFRVRVQQCATLIFGPQAEAVILIFSQAEVLALILG